MNSDLDSTDPPEVLTIEEAAAILRIGRSCAYGLARRFRASGGREGLPVIELGRNLRVPRAGLRRLLDSHSEDGFSNEAPAPLPGARAS